MNIWKFCANETTTMPTKSNTERTCNGLEITLVAFGKKCAKSKPNTIGNPKSSRICSNIGMKGIISCGMSFLILMRWLYNDPQKKKLKGVTIGANEVVMAVNEMESAVLPLERDERKLDMFPPGQDATNNIPNAIIGVMKGFRIKAMAKVTAGKPTHCNRTPTMMDFGLLKISFNIFGFRPRATPNITNANMIFTIVIPPVPKLMVTELSISSCSFIFFQI